MATWDVFNFALNTQSLRHDLPESHSERCINGKEPTGCLGMEKSPRVALAVVFVAPLIKMLIGLSAARWGVTLNKLLKMLCQGRVSPCCPAAGRYCHYLVGSASKNIFPLLKRGKPNARAPVQASDN